MRTFRGGTGWSAPTWPAATAGAYDTTTWGYQEHSGLLTNKTDAAGRAVSFTYLDGILHSRSWARSTGGNPVTNAFPSVATTKWKSLVYIQRPHPQLCYFDGHCGRVQPKKAGVDGLD